MDYELKHPFSYAVSAGETKEAEKIEITAPTKKITKYVNVIDTEYNKAIMRMTENIDEDTAENIKEKSSSVEEKDVNSKEFVALMLGYDCRVDKCYEALDKILIHTGKIDGEVKLNIDLLNKLQFEDIKSMLGEYIKFFLNTSPQN